MDLLMSYIYRIPPHAVMREVAIRWFGKYWLLAALPILAVAIWSFSDIRAIYVGVILLFLVYPMVLTIVWFHYAFSPNMIDCITAQQLLLDDSITIDYIADENRPVRRNQLIIKRDEIVAIKLRRQYVVVIYGLSPDKLILIDNAALSEQLSSLLYAIPISKNDELDAF